MRYCPHTGLNSVNEYDAEQRHRCERSAYFLYDDPFWSAVAAKQLLKTFPPSDCLPSVL